MGYSTDFTGAFELSQPLSPEQIAEFNEFCMERHAGPITPYEGVPGIWCDWKTDGVNISWNGSEKSYAMVEWGNLLLERFLKPWGITVAGGELLAQGERRGDTWKIVFRDGKFVKVNARIVYEEVP